MSMNLKLITYEPDQVFFLVDTPNYNMAIEAAIKANKSNLLDPPLNDKEINDHSNYTSTPIDINTLGEIVEINEYCGNYDGVLVFKP